MIRFRSISILLVVAALAVSARAQGTTGGLLYASDFANWTLPQGNTPAQGAITYPNQDICRVTSNGYTFLAPKVGRPITIVDGANTETVTPTSVVVGSIGCSISATMAHSHSSYFLKSGTAGAQEAIDYQASQPQGANVVLTPEWTRAGGSTGIITGTLKGNTGATILDQRTSHLAAYTWNGSAYVGTTFAAIANGAGVGNCAQIGTGNTLTDTGAPCSTGTANIANQSTGVIPLATGVAAITAQSHLDDGVTTPATITASEPIAGTGATFSGTVAAATTVSSVNAVLNESLFAGATAALRVNAACAAAATPLTPVIIPASETDATMTTPTAHCQVIDYRGTSIPTYYGAFGNSNTSGFTNGILGETFETRTANATTYQAFANRYFYFAALKGGSYFYPNGPTGLGSGTKTDYFNMNVSSTYNTIGQKTGVAMLQWSTAGGETMGFTCEQTEAGGGQGNGEEPDECVRTQQQQASPTTVTGGASAGTVTSITGSGPYTVALNGLTGYSGEHCCFRDLGTVYSTGTFVSAVNAQNTPVSGVTTVTITGSGTAWSTLGVGSHTGYNYTGASSGFIVTSANLCFTISGAQHDTYDVTLPINSIVDDTHLTVIPYAVGSSVNTGWFAGWPSSGSYQINGCAYPSSVDGTPGNVSTWAGNITTPDASGLTVGHTVDQTLAYNKDFIANQVILTRHIGRASYGGGIDIVDNSTVGAPNFQYGMAVSGHFLAAIALQISGQANGPPSYLAYGFGRPGTAWIGDPVGTAATPVLFSYRDTNLVFQNPISYNTNAASLNPGLLYFGAKAGIDTSGNISGATLNTPGSANIGGTMTAANLSSGPYANQVLDSNFQNVGTSGTPWISAGGGVTFTANAAADVWGGTTAIEVNGGSGTLTQTTSVAMTAGNTYAFSVYAQATTPGPTVFLSVSLYNTAGNTGCAAGGGVGIPSSVPVTAALTKYTFYCTATVNDTMRVLLGANGTASPIFLSVAQIAGSPLCTTNCTVTGAPAVTTTVGVSGTGILSRGSPFSNGAITAVQPLIATTTTGTVINQGTLIERLMPNSNSASLSAIGNSATFCTGTTGAWGGANSARPVIVALTGDATLGHCVGWTSTLAAYSVARQPFQLFGLLFPSSADFNTTNSTVVWLGLFSTCTAATMEASATPAGCDIAAIRYAPGTDTVYQCVTSSAGTISTSSIGTAAPSTTFTAASISFNAALNAVTCTVGNQSVVVNTNVPASSITMSDIFTNTNKTTTALHMTINGVQGYDMNSLF